VEGQYIKKIKIPLFAHFLLESSVTWRLAVWQVCVHITMRRIYKLCMFNRCHEKLQFRISTSWSHCGLDCELGYSIN